MINLYKEGRMFKLTLQILLGGLLFCFLAACGSSGNNNAAGVTTPNTSSSTEKITVTGNISLPNGIKPTSVKVESLNASSAVSENGSFSTSVYKDGVAVLSATPEGKDYSFLNIVVTSQSASSSSGKTTQKVTSASSVNSNNTIVISAKTTAVSMVFMTPYFLTSNPTNADKLIKIIENDSKLPELENKITSTFISSNDPFTDTGLQNALIDCVKSSLNTVMSQNSTLAKSTMIKAANIVTLPKDSQLKAVSKSVGLLPTSSYTASGIKNTTVDIIDSGGNYKFELKSLTGLASIGLDSFGLVSKLNASDYSSLSKLTEKSSDIYSIYQGENNVLGLLYASSESVFKYFDILDLAMNTFYDKMVGSYNRKVTVPSTSDGVYLIRSYNGTQAIGNRSLYNHIISNVPSGSSMSENALQLNMTMMSLEGISVLVDLKSLSVDKAVAAGLAVLAQHKDTPKNNVKNLMIIMNDMEKAMISTLYQSLLESGAKKMFVKVGETVVKSIIDIPGKVSNGGQALQRIGQLLAYENPMDATIVVIGTPFSAPEPTCTAPQVLTNGVCVTPTSTCTAPQVLTNGVCVTPTPTCTAPQVLTNGVCVTPTCTAPQVLTNGVCVTPPPTTVKTIGSLGVSSIYTNAGWGPADTFCKSGGMRLPTYPELSSIIQDSYFSSTTNDLWTTTQFSGEYYRINTSTGSYGICSGGCTADYVCVTGGATTPTCILPQVLSNGVCVTPAPTNGDACIPTSWYTGMNMQTYVSGGITSATSAPSFIPYVDLTVNINTSTLSGSTFEAYIPSGGCPYTTVKVVDSGASIVPTYTNTIEPFASGSKILIITNTGKWSVQTLY